MRAALILKFGQIEEYSQDTDTIVLEIERLLDRNKLAVKECEPATETDAVRKIRLKQNFFRRVVLSNYEFRCCLSGLPIPELLRASHIVPWSRSEKDRLNPRNGLCLAATFDSAFDRGLIWIDQDFRLRLTEPIRRFQNDNETSDVFVQREGNKLQLPEKNLPDKKFLKWHQENVAILD